MPSTDRKLELKAKTSVAQTASQAAVYAKGLTSVLDEGGWLMPHPACFTPGKDHCIGDLCGPQSRSRQVWEISLPPRFDPRTAQPVASHYTDCAILAHILILKQLK
jgi:hypothetical protein